MPKKTRGRRKHSAETRAKLSASATGRIFTPETKAKISASMTGKKRSSETRAKVSKARKGKKLSAAHKDKIAAANKGSRPTAAARAKMSETRKAKLRAGSIKIKLHSTSKAEKHIAEFLRSEGVEFNTQHHIPGVSYRYDFFIPEKNLLIEYQGDYWHANPRRYSEGTLLSLAGSGKGPIPVEEIWERDANKKKQAEVRGYRVVYVWEMDYKKDGVDAVLKALKLS